MNRPAWLMGYAGVALGAGSALAAPRAITGTPGVQEAYHGIGLNILINAAGKRGRFQPIGEAILGSDNTSMAGGVWNSFGDAPEGDGEMPDPLPPTTQDQTNDGSGDNDIEIEPSFTLSSPDGEDLQVRPMPAPGAALLAAVGLILGVRYNRRKPKASPGNSPPRTIRS